MLLLRNNLAVPDTLLTYFASLDEFRYRLYGDLVKMNKEDRFPAVYKTQQLHAQSRLVAYKTYGKPDTLVYLDKLPVRHKDIDGVIYFFKYKEKKDDNTWKLASAGLYPNNSTVLALPGRSTEEEDDGDLDFTRLTGTKLSTETTVREQLEKMLKKLLYNRRNSAVQFYEEDDQYNDVDVARTRY